MLPTPPWTDPTAQCRSCSQGLMDQELPDGQGTVCEATELCVYTSCEHQSPRANCAISIPVDHLHVWLQAQLRILLSADIDKWHCHCGVCGRWPGGGICKVVWRKQHAAECGQDKGDCDAFQKEQGPTFSSLHQWQWHEDCQIFKDLGIQLHDKLICSTNTEAIHLHEGSELAFLLEKAQAHVLSVCCCKHNLIYCGVLEQTHQSKGCHQTE